MPYILGIDAAWTAHNPSGISLLRYEPGKPLRVIKIARSYHEFLERDAPDWRAKPVASPPLLTEIVQYCRRHDYDVQVVALDIPLAPQPVRSYREADRALTRAYSRRGAPVHSPTSIRPGVISDLIYQQLTDAGFRWAGSQAVTGHSSFIEVYPHAAIIELFGYDYRLPYKVQKRGQYWKADPPATRYQKSIDKLQELKQQIERLVAYAPEVSLPVLSADAPYSLSMLKGYEDVLDSLVSALTGYAYQEGKATAYGNEDGAIWVPNALPAKDQAPS